MITAFGDPARGLDAGWEVHDRSDVRIADERLTRARLPDALEQCHRLAFRLKALRVEPHGEERSPLHPVRSSTIASAQDIDTAVELGTVSQ
jgi:hypothetical protein